MIKSAYIQMFLDGETSLQKIHFSLMGKVQREQ